MRHKSRSHTARRNQRVVSSALLACLAFSGLAPRGADGATVPRRGCFESAVAFSEALEPVIEAVTDGRPSKVLPAAKRATSFADSIALDHAMGDLKTSAAEHRSALAARAALVASTMALDACTEKPTAAARLARIDLAGMAGWLRVHGVNAPFPGDVAQAALAISDRLRASGHKVLADRLTVDVAATLEIPVRATGDIRAANRLLECVDEAERVVR